LPSIASGRAADDAPPHRIANPRHNGEWQDFIADGYRTPTLWLSGWDWIARKSGGPLYWYGDGSHFTWPAAMRSTPPRQFAPQLL
jgi:hypothetical protein